MVVQRVSFLLPLLHLRERTIDIAKDSGVFAPKVEEFCAREMKFCNFEEKHRCLSEAKVKFSKGTLFCLYNGWQSKNVSEFTQSIQ